MEKYTLKENFGDSDYDINFDLQFNWFECCLIVPYAIFVFPFVLVGEKLMFTFQRYKRVHTVKDHQSRVQPEGQIGPCCPWPRVLHR